MLSLIAAACTGTVFDPDPEFVVVVENPCSSPVGVQVVMQGANGETRTKGPPFTVDAHSTYRFNVGLTSEDVVVQTENPPWESRQPSADRGETLTFRVGTDACP